MTIHTLPNGASWDDELDFGNQSEEAQEFWATIQSTTPVEIKEPSINPNMDRLVSKTWVDTSYDNYNYQIVLTRNYQNSAMHQKAFALQGSTITYEILSK